MINRNTLEEVDEIFLNCIDSINELTKDTFKERVDFMKRAFDHLDGNVIKDDMFGENLSSSESLMKRVKRNANAFRKAALDNLNEDNFQSKKPMLVNWLSYYERQIKKSLTNGK